MNPYSVIHSDVCYKYMRGAENNTIYKLLSRVLIDTLLVDR